MHDYLWCVWARFRFHIVWGTKCVQVLVVFARYDCFAILCVDGERGRAGAGRPRPGRSGRGRVRLRGTAYLGGEENLKCENVNFPFEKKKKREKNAVGKSRVQV